MMHGFGFGGACGFGPWGGFTGLGWLGPVLNLALTLGVIVGAILLVFWLVRRLAPASPAAAAAPARAGETPSGREILQARYARGEITREQYLEMLADLG